MEEKKMSVNTVNQCLLSLHKQQSRPTKGIISMSVDACFPYLTSYCEDIIMHNSAIQSTLNNYLITTEP